MNSNINSLRFKPTHSKLIKSNGHPGNNVMARGAAKKVFKALLRIRITNNYEVTCYEDEFDDLDVGDSIEIEYTIYNNDIESAEEMIYRFHHDAIILKLEEKKD